MANSINQILTNVDDFVWGVPLMVLILAGGILLTLRLGILQIRKLPLALKYMAGCFILDDCNCFLWNGN